MQWQWSQDWVQRQQIYLCCIRRLCIVNQSCQFWSMLLSCVRTDRPLSPFTIANWLSIYCCSFTHLNRAFLRRSVVDVEHIHCPRTLHVPRTDVRKQRTSSINLPVFLNCILDFFYFWLIWNASMFITHNSLFDTSQTLLGFIFDEYLAFSD